MSTHLTPCDQHQVLCCITYLCLSLCVGHKAKRLKMDCVWWYLGWLPKRFYTSQRTFFCSFFVPSPYHIVQKILPNTINHNLLKKDQESFWIFEMPSHHDEQSGRSSSKPGCAVSIPGSASPTYWALYLKNNSLSRRLKEKTKVEWLADIWNYSFPFPAGNDNDFLKVCNK